jgi:hypothetical protein
MGRILCKSHGASGVVHVSSDIAADMKKDAGRLQMFRYDIDWLGDGFPDISYFVSTNVAKQSGLPEPGATPFGLDFEEAHATVFDGLVPVCEKCFDEYLKGPRDRLGPGCAQRQLSSIRSGADMSGSRQSRS